MNAINITSLNLNGKVVTEIADGTIYEPDNALVTATGIKSLVNETVADETSSINELINGSGSNLTTTAKTIIPAINEINAKNSVPADNVLKCFYMSCNPSDCIISENVPSLDTVSDFRVIGNFSENISLNSNYVKILNWNGTFTITELKKPIELHVGLSGAITKILPSATTLHVYLNGAVSTSLAKLTSATTSIVVHVNTASEIPTAFWTALNASGASKIKIITEVANKLKNLTFEGNTTVTEITANFLFVLKERLFYNCSSLVSVEFEYVNPCPTDCFYNNTVNTSYQAYLDWLAGQ